MSSSSKQSTVASRQQTADGRQQTADGRQQTADCEASSRFTVSLVTPHSSLIIPLHHWIRIPET